MVIDILLKVFKNDPTIKRHLLKSATWRIAGSLDLFIILWLLSGRFYIGVVAGMLEAGTKLILYFIHERIWRQIKFGLPSRVEAVAKIKKENQPNLFFQTSKITRQQREERNENQSFTIWLTGLSSSGKSTIADELDNWFYSHGYRAYIINGDNIRLGVNNDLSFSNEDRGENIRRVAEICKLFNEAGIICIASFISPFERDRVIAKTIIGEQSFVETFVDAPINICKERDKKGLYKLAESGKIKNFTGVSSVYEVPVSPAIHIHSDMMPLNDCILRITKTLAETGKICIKPIN